MFLLVPWLAEKVFNKPELLTPMRWMALAVVPLSLQILHGEMLKGLKRIMASALVYEHGLGISALSILGLYLLGPVWGATGAVWAFVLASLVTLGMGYWLWRAATPQLRAVDGQIRHTEHFPKQLAFVLGDVDESGHELDGFFHPGRLGNQVGRRHFQCSGANSSGHQFHSDRRQ